VVRVLALAALAGGLLATAAEEPYPAAGGLLAAATARAATLGKYTVSGWLTFDLGRLGSWTSSLRIGAAYPLFRIELDTSELGLDLPLGTQIVDTAARKRLQKLAEELWLEEELED